MASKGKNANWKKPLYEINELRERLKNEIFVKNTSRSQIIKMLMDEGYTESTAVTYYAEIVNEIKADFAEKRQIMREYHIKQHEANIELADQIENIKDRIYCKTQSLHRIEKITGLEETTVKHEGINININIDGSLIPDIVKRKINESE